ncbi:uncharacterized protein LOC113495771 isoform X2 [Trichoplusia ni]|uniref:Uncharacterized protein LOC113495771 isoform X2 n=1 Tax=Trichoplusia ni TaxID=7111 RepID=A0A7E5VQD3_TRINI|nr:uncharacterized protein LOC113495771 isoform X2 [Trichoplusia ni]
MDDDDNVGAYVEILESEYCGPLVPDVLPEEGLAIPDSTILVDQLHKEETLAIPGVSVTASQWDKKQSVTIRTSANQIATETCSSIPGSSTSSNQRQKGKSLVIRSCSTSGNQIDTLTSLSNPGSSTSSNQSQTGKSLIIRSCSTSGNQIDTFTSLSIPGSSASSNQRQTAKSLINRSCSTSGNQIDTLTSLSNPGSSTSSNQSQTGKSLIIRSCSTSGNQIDTETSLTFPGSSTSSNQRQKGKSLVIRSCSTSGNQIDTLTSLSIPGSSTSSNQSQTGKSLIIRSCSTSGNQIDTFTSLSIPGSSASSNQRQTAKSLINRSCSTSANQIATETSLSIPGCTTSGNQRQVGTSVAIPGCSNWAQDGDSDQSLAIAGCSTWNTDGDSKKSLAIPGCSSWAYESNVTSVNQRHKGKALEFAGRSTSANQMDTEKSPAISGRSTSSNRIDKGKSPAIPGCSTSSKAKRTKTTLATPGCSSSKTVAIIPRHELPQEGTAHEVTVQCANCLKKEHADDYDVDDYAYQYQQHKKKKYHIEVKNSHEMQNITKEEFNDLCLNYIINTLIPLQYVIDPQFVNFMHYMNIPKPYLYQLEYRHIKRDLNKEYERQLKELKNIIINTDYVCTSMDLWKNARYYFLCVTAHWITEDFHRVSVALALKDVGESDCDVNNLRAYAKQVYTQFGLLNADKNNAEPILDDFRSIVRGYQAYGLSIDSYECGEAALMYYILEQPDDTESIGNMQMWVRDEYLTEYNSYARLDDVTCSSRKLRLTLTHDIKKNAPCVIIEHHTTVMDKCCHLWRAAGCNKNTEIFHRVLGQNLMRPNSYSLFSLYEALMQILSIRGKYLELHNALGFQHEVMTDKNFQYIEEHLECAMPIMETVELLGANNNYYGNVLPRLTALITTLADLEQSDLLYGKHLAALFRRSILSRFDSIISGKGPIAQHAAIAAISCPMYKDNWMDFYPESYRRVIHQRFAILISNKLSREQSASANSLLTEAKSIMENYLRDGREDITTLNSYPEIKKIFFEYNTFLAKAKPLNELFNFQDIVNLMPDFGDDEPNKLQRIFLKYNFQSMQLLRLESVVSSD